MVGRLIDRRRARRGLLVGAAVLLAHLLLIDRLAATLDAGSAHARRLPRLQVVYLREMRITEPPVLAPGRAAPPFVAERPAQHGQPAPASAFAASQPAAPAVDAGAGDPPATAIEPSPAIEVAAASEPPGSGGALAGAPPAPGVAPSAAATAASAAVWPSFEWPPSTRLSYRLTGNFRGEVHGSAQVEWINAMPRYQVHLDVTVGLPFAPLFARQMSSDGLLTLQGLRPERYDEQTRRAFGTLRQRSLRIDAAGVTLADGRRWLRPPVDAAVALDPATLQDSASQFVQLSYLFTTQPQLLTTGTTIAFALALPGRVAPWFYEVGERQMLHTPFGAVETFHVFPQAAVAADNELLAQAWFAPQLANLPVRIRIEQDAGTYLDMMIDRRPELAAQ